MSKSDKGLGRGTEPLDEAVKSSSEINQEIMSLRVFVSEIASLGSEGRENRRSRFLRKFYPLAGLV